MLIKSGSQAGRRESGGSTVTRPNIRNGLTVLLIAAVSLACRGRTTSPDYRAFVTDATAYLNTQQEALQRDFHLSTYARFNWSQTTGEIVFYSKEDIPKVIAQTQAVGDVSNKSGTWLWAWDNPSLDSALSKDLAIVREYGKSKGFKELTEAKWTADEQDGWEMTAITAKLLKAKGAYRCPTKGGPLFLVLTDIHWAEPQPAPQAPSPS